MTTKSNTEIQSLLLLIKYAEPNKLKEILCVQSGYNIVKIITNAALYQPTLIPAILEFIAKLPEKEQISIWTAKDNWGSNALMLAAGYQPTAIPAISQGIVKLPEKEQISIWTAKDYRGYNALMLAARYQPTAIHAILQGIAKLPEEEQISIWTAKDHWGYNTLMLAARYQPTAIHAIFQGIAKLPEKEQISIWTAQTNDGYNAMMLAIQCQPTATAKMLEELSKMKYHTQIRILRDVERKETLVETFKTNLKRFLNDKIAELDSSDPIEKAIKIALKSMYFNAAYKQAAVVDALLALKKSPNYTKSSLEDAINDKSSALYHSLNLKRYGCWPFSSQSEARSIKKIRDVTKFQFFKTTSSVEENDSIQKNEAPKDIIPHILIPLLPS